MNNESEHNGKENKLFTLVLFMTVFVTIQMLFYLFERLWLLQICCKISVTLAHNGPHIHCPYRYSTYMLCIWNNHFKAEGNAWRQFCNALSHHGIGLQEIFINSDTNQMQLRGGVRITWQLFSALSLQCHLLYIH